VADHDDMQVVASLGTSEYFRLMAAASAMVGNSSSGIIEAASFELPVVNVGNRQRGRSHGANVLDVPPERDAIAAAIRRAVAPEFRAGLRGLRNPYGDGQASGRIVAVLRDAPPRADLLVKRLPGAA
jgi:UDP-N-acetylglucosamine 2-epimerase